MPAEASAVPAVPVTPGRARVIFREPLIEVAGKGLGEAVPVGPGVLQHWMVGSASVRFGARTHTGGRFADCRVAPDMGFVTHPLDHVRVVQFECRALRADSGQFGEVVPRRRTTGRPFQRVAVAPRVIDRHRLAVTPALEHVPGERQDRYTEDERADSRHHMQPGESSVGR